MKIDYKMFEEFSKLCEITSKDLSDKLIVGWFQNGSEMGPRALGNRSILTDPRNKDAKKNLNILKGREWWRPVAPIVLEEERDNWFNLNGKLSPYMLFSATVKDDKKELIPGIMHEDNTARVQTVNEKQNYRVYNLLKCFYNITGIPVLVNTSFNGPGEPIVETPNDAMNTFKSINLDILVIENFYFKKE